MNDLTSHKNCDKLESLPGEVRRGDNWLVYPYYMRSLEDPGVRSNVSRGPLLIAGPFCLYPKSTKTCKDGRQYPRDAQCRTMADMVSRLLKLPTTIYAAHYEVRILVAVDEYHRRRIFRAVYREDTHR